MYQHVTTTCNNNKTCNNTFMNLFFPMLIIIIYEHVINLNLLLFDVSGVGLGYLFVSVRRKQLNDQELSVKRYLNSKHS